GRDLIDELYRSAERWELPGSDQHVAVPFPVFGLGQPLEDFRFAELLHLGTSIRPPLERACGIGVSQLCSTSNITRSLNALLFRLRWPGHKGRPGVHAAEKEYEPPGPDPGRIPGEPGEATRGKATT